MLPQRRPDVSKTSYILSHTHHRSEFIRMQQQARLERPCPPKDEVNRLAKLAPMKAPDQQTFALDSVIAEPNLSRGSKLIN